MQLGRCTPLWASVVQNSDLACSTPQRGSRYLAIPKTASFEARIPKQAPCLASRAALHRGVHIVSRSQKIASFTVRIPKQASYFSGWCAPATDLSHQAGGAPADFAPQMCPPLDSWLHPCGFFDPCAPPPPHPIVDHRLSRGTNRQSSSMLARVRHSARSNKTQRCKV